MRLIREKSLPKARLSGEGLNLFLIVDEAELPEESLATLDPILDEYEVVLDQAIRRRDEVVATTSAQMYRAIQEGDTPGAMRTMERQMQARTALRDVNELYRVRLVSELGEGTLMNLWRFLMRWFVPPFIGLILVFGFLDKIQDQYHVQLPGALEAMLGPNWVAPVVVE